MVERRTNKLKVAARWGWWRAGGGERDCGRPARAGGAAPPLGGARGGGVGIVGTTDWPAAAAGIPVMKSEAIAQIPAAAGRRRPRAEACATWCTAAPPAAAKRKRAGLQVNSHFFNTLQLIDFGLAKHLESVKTLGVGEPQLSGWPGVYPWRLYVCSQ